MLFLYPSSIQRQLLHDVMVQRPQHVENIPQLIANLHRMPEASSIMQALHYAGHLGTMAASGRFC